MNALPRKVLEEAMKLPPEARAALAASLLESLDERIDEDAEVAWAAEIGKRLAEINDGRVRPLSWAEARKSIADG